VSFDELYASASEVKAVSFQFNATFFARRWANLPDLLSVATARLSSLLRNWNQFSPSFSWRQICQGDLLTIGNDAPPHRYNWRAWFST
jgi:hypothetical protein